MRLFRHLSLRKTIGSRSISIYCRGQPINEEELYCYSGGRFLINEEYQRQRRYIKFNIPRLCDIAASTGGSVSPIRSIEKIEGGFCKALLMTKADGTQVVAKLPTKFAGPAKFSTMAEVATLKYINERTTIPVPKVLAWDFNPSNDVGNEYIIMEKAPGVQLYRKWGEMHGTSKLAFTRHLTKLEGQLASIQFPASGSLYLREFRPSFNTNPAEFVPLCEHIDPNQSYCIGPSADRSWWESSEQITPEYSKGPWHSLQHYGNDILKREEFRLSKKQSTDQRPYRRNPDHEVADLRRAQIVMDRLGPNFPQLISLSKPTLWHTDMHMGNIFVSEEDPSQITSIIDWQFVTVGPMFLQINWPEFLKPADGYKLGTAAPELPSNFSELDAEEQEAATATQKEAFITKSYELRSREQSRDVYRCLHLPTVFRELFIRSAEASAEGTIALQECLAAMFQLWMNTPQLEEGCPIQFTHEELVKIDQLFEVYREWNEVPEFAREYLQTDVEGWISPEVDFVKTQQLNKSIFEHYMEETSKHDRSQDNARRKWPFLEGL